MMFKSLRIIILSLFFVGLSPAAMATLIGFEGMANGTVVTNQFAGVTFSANAGQVNKVTTQPGIGFGSNFICTATSSINCTQQTILTFATAVNNLSFYQVGDNASGVVAKVDVFINSVFNSTVDILGFNNFNTPDLVDLTGFNNISSIRIHSVTDPGGLGWDNFNFNTTTVAEPSSLALLFLGIAGLVSRRCKKA